jgi:hypothetical protein
MVVISCERCSRPQGAAAAASQFGFLAELLVQRRPYLLREGGEIRTAVRAEDAGVGRPALPGVPDLVGDAPYRSRLAYRLRCSASGVAALRNRP